MRDVFRKKWFGGHSTNFRRAHQNPPFYFIRVLIKRLIELVFLSGLIYFLFFSDFFTVKSVEIKGTKITKKEEIRKILPVGKNIFLFPSKTISEKIIRSFSAIADVRIYRGLPKSVNVEVLEYQPKLLWQRNNSIGYINNQGFYFYQSQNGELDQKLVRVVENVQGEIEIGEKVATNSFVEFVETIAQEMLTMQDISFDRIELGLNSFNPVIKTKENIDILVASDEDIVRQMDYLRTILEKRRDKVTKIIDVRISRWAYVK